MTNNILAIVSGGQTGADMGGLLGAKSVGVHTKGFAPKGWRTENGPNPELKSFNLVENSTDSYKDRTIINVRNADFTLIVGDITSSGSQLTVKTCKQYCKPYYVSAYAGEQLTGSELTREAKRVQVVIDSNTYLFKGIIVNVAGNRESVNPGIEYHTRRLIKKLLKLCNTPDKE